ncbi:restriction endonuclease subunit S [Bifidobacterium magnum]|uniref:restriction endonuclease subunit S n=1 Tax=Bifidobacterium magnum TaxID=1692 RepID=UPI001EF9DA75|nr:restriction endonuclease subunit S [Bifidobacterium magnum]
MSWATFSSKEKIFAGERKNTVNPCVSVEQNMVEQTEHKELVPRLRFRGFTEPWRQRKLGDVCEYFKSGSFISASKIIRESLYPVFGGNGLRGYTDDFNHEGFYALIGRQGAQCGNITFSTGKAYFTEHAIAVKSFSDKETLFLGYLLLRLKLGRLSDQSAQPGLAVNKLRELTINLPIKSEQESIGLFLERLDDLIAAYEQEYELLQSKKNYYLQKVLSNYLSFESDPDRWQERKFNEIFQAVSVKGFPDLPVLSASQDLGMVYRDQLDTDIKFNKHSLAGYKRVSAGDFVISLRSFQGGFEYSTITGICSPAYTVFRFIKPNEHDPLFWKVVFKSPHFIELLKTVTFGIRDGKAISFSDVGTLRLQVPSFDEQKQIGVFFETLNNLLCAVQNKIELLQKKKKYYLQNMFI